MKDVLISVEVLVVREAEDDVVSPWLVEEVREAMECGGGGAFVNRRGEVVSLEGGNREGEEDACMGVRFGWRGCWRR